MNKSLFGFSSYLKRVLTQKDGLRIDADIATKTKGPEGVTAGVVAVFDGDTGKILKSSGYHESSYTRNAATQTLTNKTLNNPKFTQATTFGDVPVATGSDNEITWLNPHDRVNLYNSEEDLNDFRTPGVYIFSAQGYREAINAPVFPNDNSFLLEVFRYTPGDVTGSTYQRITYFRHNVTNSYFRTGTSSGWTPWKRVLSDDDVTDLPSTSTFGRVYIEDNTDLDDLMDPGIYSVASTGSFNSLSNTPPITNSYGNFVVLQVGGTSRTQQYWPSVGEQRIFIRTRSSGGVWGNWLEILTTDSDIVEAAWSPKSISNGDDLNDYDVPGTYNITSTAIFNSLSNKPPVTDKYGCIVVLRNGANTRVQIFYNANANSGLTDVWIRRKSGASTWKNWAKFLTTDDTVGDVVGPDSSSNNYFAQFDGTTGKLLKSVSLASAVPLASRTTTLAGTSSAGYISAREVGYYRDWSSATYSTSTAISFASYLNWFITVSADITFSNPSSVVAGKAGTLRLYASSKRTIDWGSYFKWPDDLGKPTEIPAGKYLVVSYVCYSTTVIYCSWAIYSD